MERLKKFGLPVSGSLDALASRDRELVIKWNANLDAAVPKSAREVAKSVSQAERYLERERRKRVHHAGVAKNCFFSSKKARIESPNLYAPAEGDDFDTLIRKLKSAKEDAKRRTEEADGEPSVKVPRGGAGELGFSMNFATARDGSSANTPVPTGSAPLPDLPSPPSVPSSPPDSELMIDVPLQQDNFSPQRESGEAIINGNTLSVKQETLKLAPSDTRRADADSIQEGQQQLDEPEVVFVTLNPTATNATTRVDTGKQNGARSLLVHQDEVKPVLSNERRVDVEAMRIGEKQSREPEVVCVAVSSTRPGVGAGTSAEEPDRALQEKKITLPKHFATPENRKKSTGLEATGPLHFAVTTESTATTPPDVTNCAEMSASQRTTQATITPNSSKQKEKHSLYALENHGTESGRTPCSATDGVATKNSIRSQLHVTNRDGLVGEGMEQGTAALTEEQRQRVEHSRMIAIERKRKYLERRQRQIFGQMRQPDLS